MNQAVTAQPTGAVQPPCIRGNREWSNTLCSCCNDFGTTAYVMCCQPCALCNMATRLGENCSCMPLCVPAGTVAMRTRLRTLAGIRGSICDDFFTLSFCGACALVQMVRELDALGL